MEFTLSQTRILLLRDDITAQDTQAIVNAANTTLLGGGGVDGAIHRAAGPELLRECRIIHDRNGGCPTGQAVLTSGANLSAEYVVHTVGPVYRDGNHGEPELLGAAYLNSLETAAEKGITSISFPSISTGAYRYPKEQACTIALNAVAESPHLEQFTEIRFVLFSDADLKIYQARASEMFGKGG